MTGKVNNGPILVNGSTRMFNGGNLVQACLHATRAILIIREHEDVPPNAMQTAAPPIPCQVHNAIDISEMVVTKYTICMATSSHKSFLSAVCCTTEHFTGKVKSGIVK